MAAAPRPFVLTLVTWVAMIGVDLALHAGLLAPLYDWGSPFLLSPEQAFVRIPVTYAAFAVLAAALVWALPRLGVRAATDGARLGAAAGAVVWGALLVGIWSIAAAPVALLVAWWVGQSMQTAVAGAVIGAAIGGVRLQRLAWWAIGLAVGGLVLAVVLQSIGYAPAPVRLGA